MSIKELRSRAFPYSNRDSYRTMSSHKINNQSHRRYCFFTLFTKKVRSVILLGKWPDKLNYKKRKENPTRVCHVFYIWVAVIMLWGALLKKIFRKNNPRLPSMVENDSRRRPGSSHQEYQDTRLRASQWGQLLVAVLCSFFSNQTCSKIKLACPLIAFYS